MRALVLLLAVLLVAPLALATPPPDVRLLSARMDVVLGVHPEEATQLGNPVPSHHRFTFTMRNEGGAGPVFTAIDTWWLVVDLPNTVWADEPLLESGETRTFVVDFDRGFWIVPGSTWFCLRATDWAWPADRCWSAFVGAAHPDGVYPETIPHWQLPGTPMGDSG